MRLFTFAFLLLVAPALTVSAQTPGHTLNEDLIYRINFGSSEDVRVLLEKGADPSAKSTQGEPVIDMAMERNDAETVRMASLLIEKGADTEALDKSGNTPLINAIRYKQTALVKLLLAKGANYHLTTTEGLTVIDYAKHFGNAESADAIQAYLNKEIAYQKSLRTPERFKEIVNQYATDSCSYQYWNYFVSSRQDPSKDAVLNKKIEDLRKKLYEAVNQVQQYYTNASVNAMQTVATAAVNNVFKDLDGMISNRNREENGVGKESDAKERCEKIVDDLHIDFTGTLRNGAASGSEPENTGTTNEAAPPLPIDPGK